MEHSETPPPADPTTRRKGELPLWASVAAIVVFLAVAGSLYYLAGLPKSGVRVEHLRDDAQRKLPAGSSRDDVLAWFAAHGITEVGDLTDPGGKKLGHHALLPNDSWLDQAEIDIRVMFDGDGKVNDLKIARYRTFNP